MRAIQYVKSKVMRVIARQDVNTHQTCFGNCTPNTRRYRLLEYLVGTDHFLQYDQVRSHRYRDGICLGVANTERYIDTRGMDPLPTIPFGNPQKMDWATYKLVLIPRVTIPRKSIKPIAEILKTIEMITTNIKSFRGELSTHHTKKRKTRWWKLDLAKAGE